MGTKIGIKGKRMPADELVTDNPVLAEADGRTFDGYLARPAESLPAFQKMRARVLESASAHGRAAGDIDFRGYLLCLFDSSRQESPCSTLTCLAASAS